MGSILPGSSFSLAFIVLCATLITAIVFVSPYKQPYERYNKLDVAMICSFGAILVGFLDSSYVSTTWVGYALCILSSLTPLVYFTIKSCLFTKHLVQKLSTWYSDSGGRYYENLSNIISVN